MFDEKHFTQHGKNWERATAYNLRYERAIYDFELACCSILPSNIPYVASIAESYYSWQPGFNVMLHTVFTRLSQYDRHDTIVIIIKHRNCNKVYDGYFITLTYSATILSVRINASFLLH